MLSLLTAYTIVDEVGSDGEQSVDCSTSTLKSSTWWRADTLLCTKYRLPTTGSSIECMQSTNIKLHAAAVSCNIMWPAMRDWSQHLGRPRFHTPCFAHGTTQALSIGRQCQFLCFLAPHRHSFSIQCFTKGKRKLKGHSH